jgi:hypothetical protein
MKYCEYLIKKKVGELPQKTQKFWILILKSIVTRIKKLGLIVPNNDEDEETCKNF